MDRSTSRPVPYLSGGRPARVRLPRASALSISADVCLDPSGCSANKADNHRAMLRSVSRRNRHFRVPAFLPCRLAGKKFPWCARRHRKCLRNSNRDSPRRDTSFPMEEEVRVLSSAFDLHRVTTPGHAACMHKCSLGIFQQLFNHRFGFTSVYNLGVDHVVT